MKTKSIKLNPEESFINIRPNIIGYKQVRVDDDEAPDGFYFKTEEYILDKPNLIVSAKIKCNNEFKTNYNYVSESNILWIATCKNILVNTSNFIEEFIFPKELVCIGAPFTHETGRPS